MQAEYFLMVCKGVITQDHFIKKRSYEQMFATALTRIVIIP